MLSRVADSIYWMNRYIERAENYARFIDANYQMILDLPGGAKEQWEPLILATGDQERFREKFGEADHENVIYFLAFDEDNPNSILSCLRGARENARSVREYISSEMWEQVNTFYMMVRDGAGSASSMGLPHQFFVKVMMESHHMIGVTDSTMSHGEGWHFGRLGRMIERADKTSRILDVKYFILLPSLAYVGTPYDQILWTAILRSTSAFEMYRKKYGEIVPDQIVNFLILDREFPRAIHYCLTMADESLRAISGTPPGSFRNLPEQVLGKMLSDLHFTGVEEIFDSGLHEFLDELQGKFVRVGDAIQESYFTLGMTKGTDSLFKEERQ